MKDPRIALIGKTFKKLLKANGTVTTLEIKTDLRTEFPYYRWEQQFISDEVANIATTEGYSFKFNGTFRTYTNIPVKTSIPTPRKSGTISRKTALNMMQKSGGKFITVEFVKDDKTVRTLNGQYIKDQKMSPLGYVLMKESGKMKKGENPIRNVNLQTLKSLRMGGITYRVK